MGLVDGVVVELSPDITGQWWTLKQKKMTFIHTYKGGYINSLGVKLASVLIHIDPNIFA